jgi:hypothetical protein
LSLVQTASQLGGMTDSESIESTHSLVSKRVTWTEGRTSSYPSSNG